MTSKTTVGVFAGADEFVWLIAYEQPWWGDGNRDRPDAHDFEDAFDWEVVPLLRPLESFLSINLSAGFSFYDLIVGVQVTVSDEAPDPAEFTDVEHWSEVSVRFEAHKDAFDWEGTFGGFGGSEPLNRHPELQALKIPPGTWRVRAEATTAPGGSNDIYQHVDYIDPTDYENGKGTWDTLPFQLHLWFWPEPELREAKHSLAQQKLADKYVVAEQEFIKEWREKKAIK